MTKWVTFLLLLLAVLAFGLSKMRPMPTEPSANATETPTVAKAEATPAATAEPTEPDPALTSSGATGTSPASPKFARPASSPTPGATAAAVATSTTPKPRVAVKTDPFSKGAKKPKPVTGAIKATVLSASANGRSRTRFPADTSSIYLTATPEGIKGNVEITASYRSVMDEKSNFSEPVPSSGPARRRSFRLLAPADGWKSGPYQVVIKAQSTGQVLGMDRFEILAKDEEIVADQPAPDYLDLVPNLEALEAQSSFSSRDESILLRVSAQELEPGTNIRSVWSAVEVDRLTSGELIAVASRPSPGPGKDAIFTFEAPPGGFHSGSYKVDIYFDQTLAGSQAFFIQPPSATKE